MRNLYLYILIAVYFLLACCGKHDKAESQQSLEDVRVQYNTYVQLAPSGWQQWDRECDALLFASLQTSAEQKTFDIESARDSSGQWHRRPQWADCETGPNDSTISRDMLMGLLVYALNAKRLDIVEDLWDYGQAHSTAVPYVWKMGSDNRSNDNRTYTVPGLVQLMAKIIAHLGGTRHEVELAIPQVYGSEPGFPSHLTMLHIYMNGKIDGQIGSNQLDVLRSIRSHSPNNPLANALIGKYTDGDQSRTLEVLSIWPADRLPTSMDWQSDWRTQRADGDPSFQPGTDNNPHAGGDYLFVAALLLGYIQFRYERTIRQNGK